MPEDWAWRANFLLCSHHRTHLGRCYGECHYWDHKPVPRIGRRLVAPLCMGLHWATSRKQGMVLNWAGRAAQESCCCFPLHPQSPVNASPEKIMSSSSLLWHEGPYAHKLPCCTEQQGFPAILLLLLEIIFKDRHHFYLNSQETDNNTE